MLGVLCARPKPWLLASLFSFHAHGLTAAAHHRLAASPIRSVLVAEGDDQRRLHHSTSCRFGGGAEREGGAASIWHAILPARGRKSMSSSRAAVFHRHNCELTKKGGEGSWNAAWDARPARWLHNADSAWLLFGVCPCLAAPPLFDLSEVNSDAAGAEDQVDILSSDSSLHSPPPNYRVTGVPADGRCLFRAIAHVDCLRNGGEAPNENRQRELADELRAKVVDELLQRREEAEWFIEGDFDAYVKTIEKPYVWGGEPELLMASHVLQTPISVFMIHISSGSLINISNYGEEYRKDGESPINVLFHGYGHYDIVETNILEE